MLRPWNKGDRRIIRDRRLFEGTVLLYYLRLHVSTSARLVGAQQIQLSM